MSTQAVTPDIDLSAGLVPKAPASDGIDLSAGFVPKAATPTAAPVPSAAAMLQPAPVASRAPQPQPPVAGAGALGVPQLPTPQQLADRTPMQTSDLGTAYDAAKEGLTHPLETLVGADLPSQEQAKLDAIGKTAAGGDKFAQSVLDAQRDAHAPLIHPSESKRFQKVLDPHSKNVVSRVLTGGTKAVEALSSPDNLMMLGTLPLAPEDATSLLSGVFGAQMAQGAGQDSYEALRAAHRGDYGEAAEKGATALISAAMAAASAKHALHPAGEVPAGARPAETAAAEPEKPVLHGSDDVEELRASAERQAPKLGDAAAAAAEGVPGAKLEAVRDAKDTDRIEDKSERQGVKPSQIADIAAAKITVPDQAAAEQVLAKLHEQMPVESVNGDLTAPGKNGVRQVQAVVNTGAAGEPVQRAEILIQTPEMAEATDRTHDDYRKAQELRAEAERLESGIVQRHDEAHAATQERLQGSAVPAQGAADVVNPETKEVRDKSPEPAAGGGQGAAPAAEPVERRVDGEGRKRIAEMSPEEMRQTLLTSDKVDLPNRRAFDEEQQRTPAKAVAMSDADGLKAMNDRYGYAAGDELLRAKAEALREAGVEAYHDKGDEFLYRGDSPDKLKDGLERARTILRNREIEATMADGTVRRFKGADFSYGTGTDTTAAESGLKQHKADRESRGERARGELRGITEVGPQTGEGGARAAEGAAGGERPSPRRPAEPAKLTERPAIGGHDGRATEVLTTARRMPSTYRLVEAADLVPSHDARTFAENATYPKGVQERDYKGSKEAQNRVIQQAQNYDPAYTVNTNPDAVNGPPVVTPDGTVLGGNSRAMSTQRLYADGRGEVYKDTLKRDAATYGLTPEQVDGMKEPVLVRQIPQPESVDEARRIGSELNKSMTGALGVSERAVSAGKNLKPETLRAVAEMMQQDDLSLRELLSKHGADVLKMMQADGAITERERPQFIDAATGGLSEEGKTFFERALLGSVVDDSRLMDRAPKGILSKLERSMGAIAGFGARPDEWNLLPAIRAAVAEHATIVKNGSTVELHLGQRDMFAGPRNPVVDALVRVLDEKPNTVRAKFEQYAKDADQNPTGQSKMFGGGEAFDAFNEAFGSKLTEQEYLDASAETRTADPAEESPSREQGKPAPRDGSVSGSADRDAAQGSSGSPERESQSARAPVPPASRVEARSGTAERRDAELVRAPKPPQKEAEETFQPGRQSTPIEVRDADGTWQHGTLDYYNDGVNGTPRRGRVTLENGEKRNNVADADMREPKPLTPKKGTGTPAEEAMAEQVRENGHALTTEYLRDNTSDGVAYIAKDAVKRVFPEYREDATARNEDANAPATAIQEEAKRREYAKPIRDGRDAVQIATGAPASGKTTGGDGSVGDRIGLVLESIFDSKEHGREVIDQALAAGRHPVIDVNFTNDPRKNAERMIDRAKKIGRVVPIEYMARTYVEVPRIVAELKAEYGDRITVNSIDNSGAPGEAVPYKDGGAAALKASQEYTVDTAREAMRDTLDKLKGSSTEAIDREARRGLKERGDAEAVHGRGQRQPSEGSSGQSEKERRKGDELDGARLGKGTLSDGTNASHGTTVPGQGDLDSRRGTGDAEQKPAAEVDQHNRTADDTQRDSRQRQDSESKANAERAAKRKADLESTADRTLAENAAAHKSNVEEVAGHKAVVLDAPGERVWHELFKKIKGNPLGAGEQWRGASLDRTGVNMAIAYLKGGAEDLRVAGVPDSGGFDRMADLLKAARNEQGGATVLRGDYRADTAREEATHQWQREHGLDRSEAMMEVASRPDFAATVDKLRDMGYDDATPRTVATELMAKAMAGDADLDLTDAEREDLVRSFLTEAVEEKGAGILKNLPETDARLTEVIDQVRKGYDDGEQHGRRNEAGGQQAVRGADGEARRNLREGDQGTRAGAGRGESGGERVQRGEEEGTAPKGELKKPTGSDEPVFQRAKAPRPPSMALPGMEDAAAERERVAGEEEGRRLTEQMRRPLGDISRDAGKMERDSPLFFGQGENQTLFQRDTEAEKQNPWYLKSGRVLAEKMKGPMPGDALVRMLENNGVKADELKWSGLEELKGRVKITPAEVNEHLAENALKIEEVTKGEPVPDFTSEREAIHDAGDKGEIDWQEATRRLDALREREDELMQRGGAAGNVKYKSYQLPGGENYRELLLIAPDSADRAPAGSRAAQGLEPGQDFRSGHWDEPNVLAHVRFNDRVTPQGKKLLHIEEIQSDWHQKGRDAGYGSEADLEAKLVEQRAVMKAAREAHEAAESEYRSLRTQLHALDQDGQLNSPEGKEVYQKLADMRERRETTEDAREAAAERYRTLQGKGPGVPNAPFKKDWHEMAFRRMVKMAADKGYDGVSWTPGEKQAERYDLSKSVRDIDYQDNNRLIVHSKGGDLIHNDIVEPDKLADVIGKEATRKLLDTEPRNHSGLGSSFEKSRTLYPADLKMGGEGMKGFYDKIIPDYARKFAKQWGAKVGEEKLAIGNDGKMVDDGAGGLIREGGKPALLSVQALDITPEMRADVAEKGLPLFQKAKDGENPVAKSVAELVKDLKAMPQADKGTALDRVTRWSKDAVEESLERSGKAFGSVPSAFEKAFAWAKATTAALVHDYQHPLEQTDWKTQAGQMQLAQAETALHLQALAKELKEQAPKALDRIAMTHYMEAAGNEAKLKEWQAGAKTRAMQEMGSERGRYLREAQKHYDQALRLTPEQKALAKRLRQHFDDTLEIAKQNGLVEYGYRNYVMHLYEKAEAANILHLVDTSELNPDPSFIKKRFHDTFYSAEGDGLTPKSKDIGYLLTAYDKSMNEAISSRNFMRSLLDAKAPDGRPIAAIKTRGGWVIAKDTEAPQVLNQRARPQSLEGYRDFDRPQLRNFLFKPTTADLDGFDPKLFDEDPEKLAFRGDLIIHPKYATRVEDMLTPSWFERGEGGAQKLGNAIIKGSALAKELMTAVAPFHMVQEGVHGVEHKVNPFNLPKLDLTDKTQRLLASHGLTLTNYDAEGLFGAKALKGMTEFVPGVNRLMDTMQSFSHWQFQDYIPRLKMRMATEAFERNVKRYPELSEEQVAELSAKQSNAAFGNLNTTFDAIPRTKTFKTLLRLATFAPDFLESRIRFVGQAFTRYGGEQRVALVRGALVMYAVSRMTNALLNNGDAKWDAEHAFSIVRNGKSYSLRTVQGDILHAVTDPRGFIYNRLNPLTTRPLVEFLSGRDQMGRQKSATSQAKDLAKTTLPFGVQKIIQSPDEGWLDSLLTSTGLEAKNYRTPTEEAVHKLYLAHIPDAPEDPEKQAESRKVRQIEEKVRSGHLSPTDVWAMVSKGELTPKEAGRTVQRAQKTRLQIEFQSLGLKDAMKVYAGANPLEQAELHPMLARKQALIADLPEGQRQETADKITELLAQVAKK